MKKIGKYIIQIVVTVAMLFCSLFAAFFVKNCNKTMDRKSESKVMATQFKEFASSLELQCPSYLDNWLLFKGVEYKDNQFFFQFEAEDGDIEGITKEFIQQQLLVILKRQVKEPIRFGQALEDTDTTLKLILYRTNGNPEYSIELTGEDLIKLFKQQRTN